MEASPDVLWKERERGGEKERERERWKDIKMGKEKREREENVCERRM